MQLFHLDGALCGCHFVVGGGGGDAGSGRMMGKRNGAHRWCQGLSALEPAEGRVSDASCPEMRARRHFKNRDKDERGAGRQLAPE